MEMMVDAIGMGMEAMRSAGFGRGKRSGNQGKRDGGGKHLHVEHDTTSMVASGDFKQSLGEICLKIGLTKMTGMISVRMAKKSCLQV